jgi:hypothetical protein
MHAFRSGTCFTHRYSTVEGALRSLDSTLPSARGSWIEDECLLLEVTLVSAAVE